MSVDLEAEATRVYEPDEEHRRLGRLVGEWRGTAKTWFDPSAAPIEAAWEGHVGVILGGRFVRFEYRSKVGEKPIAGEMLIAFEDGEKRWAISWVDSFHTGTAILMSTGEPGATAIDVRGTWFVEADQPRWGWRTVIADAADGFVIRMYNIKPDGEEALGVEVTLARAC